MKIGIDGIRYEEIFIAAYDGSMPKLYKHLGEYESIDELNHLAVCCRSWTSTSWKSLRPSGHGVQSGQGIKKSAWREAMRTCQCNWILQFSQLWVGFSVNGGILAVSPCSDTGMSQSERGCSQRWG
ncbi:MAG: antirestriction protein ArdA [Butyricicoccus porcorum]